MVGHILPLEDGFIPPRRSGKELRNCGPVGPVLKSQLMGVPRVPQHLPARGRTIYSRRPPSNVLTAELRPDWACSQKPIGGCSPASSRAKKAVYSRRPPSNVSPRFNANVGGGDVTNHFLYHSPVFPRSAEDFDVRDTKQQKAQYAAELASARGVKGAPAPSSPPPETAQSSDEARRIAPTGCRRWQTKPSTARLARLGSGQAAAQLPKRHCLPACTSAEGEPMRVIVATLSPGFACRVRCGDGSTLVQTSHVTAEPQ